MTAISKNIPYLSSQVHFDKKQSYYKLLVCVSARCPPKEYEYFRQSYMFSSVLWVSLVIVKPCPKPLVLKPDWPCPMPHAPTKSQ